jgi:riboflavin kinase/FMN adenylyltransferase
MPIVTTPLGDVRPRAGRRVAIGHFDGVHVGHREVLREMDTVLTFDPHPFAITHPDICPPLLMPLAARAEAAGALGVRELVVIPFDSTFARLPPQDFIDDVVVGVLGATEVSVGANFRFGHRAGGDVGTLRADGRFAVRVAALVEMEGEVVSSTRIRAMLGAGDVARAALLLGRPFCLHTTVAGSGGARWPRGGQAVIALSADARLLRPAAAVYLCRAGGALGLLVVRPGAEGELLLVVPPAVAHARRAHGTWSLRMLRRLAVGEAADVAARMGRADLAVPGGLYDDVPWQEAYAPRGAWGFGSGDGGLAGTVPVGLYAA